MAATIQTIQKPTRARALDTSGNNNHGQIYSGRALEFDGVSDDLTISDVTTGLTSCTVAIWFKKTVGNVGSLISYHSGGTYIRFTSATGLVAHVPTSGDNYTITATLNDDSSWNRAVITLTASTGKIYVNGSLSVTATASAGTLFNEPLTRIGSYAGTNYFDGKIANVQIWDAAFSADDVTYDYLNPEQLALNRGGTSLTESNLKAWYPMQDGHRGQQSFILDGAGTGLGDEILGDPEFDTDVAEGATGTYWALASGTDTWNISDGSLNCEGIEGGLNCTAQNVTIVAGTTYKIEFTISSRSAGGVLPKIGGTAGTTASSDGTHTQYITAGATTAPQFNTQSTPTLKVDSVSVKPVNAKNHATTVFFGDELLTNDDTNWDSTGAFTSWTYYDDGTNGGAGTLKQDGLSLIGGRTYSLTFVLAAGNDMGIEIKSYDDSETFVAEATYADSSSHTVTFTPSGDESGIMLNVDDSVSGACNLTTASFSLKEVGTATGWTDADQQLDIPQTALQSYNQLAWFNGKGGLGASSVSCTSGSAIAPLDPLTFSCWFSGSQTGQVGLIRHCNFNADGYGIYIVTNDNTEISVDTHHDSTATTYTTTSGTKDLLNGDLNHIVVVIDKTGSSRRVYINGSLMEQSASSFSYDTDATSTIGIGQPRNTGNEFDGIINEVSIWGDSFTLAEVQELYNDGKALDATTHSAEANLKGYWRNNGLSTWADRQDNITANNLTVNNGDQTLLIPAGVDGSRDNQGFLMNRQKDTNALNMTGIEYVDAGDGDAFTFINGGFSLECWFRMDATPANTTYLIAKQSVDSAGNSDKAEYGIYLDTNKKVFVKIQDDSASAYIGAYYNTALTVGRWYHLVCTHTEDGTASSDCKIYLGETATPTSTAVVTDVDNETGSYVAMENTTIPLYIGTRSGYGTNKSFIGMLDDVRIYSKELSAAEITRNYNAGKRSHR